MTVAITPTVQDTWPPRVALAVTGLTPGDQVTVYRSVVGGQTAVRGADGVDVDATSFVVTDAELPFGVPVTWLAWVNGTQVATTATDSYPLDGGKVALSDAITGLAAEVVIGAWPSKRRERRATSFALTTLAGSGYNVVVSGPLGQAGGQLEVATTTESDADSLVALVENTTGGVVQLRSATQPRNNCYMAVLALEEVRFTQDGTDPERKWVLDYVEVPGWPVGLVAQNWTYDDLATAYTGGDYDALAGDFATYLDLAVADIGAI